MTTAWLAAAHHRYSKVRDVSTSPVQCQRRVPQWGLCRDGTRRNAHQLYGCQFSLSFMLARWAGIQLAGSSQPELSGLSRPGNVAEQGIVRERFVNDTPCIQRSYGLAGLPKNLGVAFHSSVEPWQASHRCADL